MSEAAPTVVRVPAHAKANLFLRVLARESSGFHSIETLFTLLELSDELTVEATKGGIELAVEGPDTGPADENLAARAARLVLEATGYRFGVRMRLVKRIPVQAGLGGGSSDGAAALHAVNSLARHAVPRHEILQLAAKLGSDVVFFASGAPLALGWGRGERLYRVPPPPGAPALLAVPSFGISTPDAYAALDAAREHHPPRGAIVLDPSAFDTWGNIGRLGGNDFESVAFGKDPRLRDLFERVASTRPLLVRLSGSGSAILAVYQTDGARDAASKVIGERDQRLIHTATRSVPAPAPTPATG